MSGALWKQRDPDGAAMFALVIVHTVTSYVSVHATDSQSEAKPDLVITDVTDPRRVDSSSDEELVIPDAERQ